MMSSKVHSQRNIPFSWENEPGVSKAVATAPNHPEGPLPPPPAKKSSTRATYHDMQIPLPPCAFQPPLRSSSKKGTKKTDDPFLIAYKEVTKSAKKGKFSSMEESKGDQIRFGIMKNISIFSCKQSSCGVDDSVVRLSHLPISRRD